MKNKIKEALKQEYKNLGLSDEAFEGVAAFGETFVKEEADIPNFVKGAEKTLKQIQAAGDRARTEATKAKQDLEAAQKELNELKAKHKTEGGDDDTHGDDDEGKDKKLAEIVATAVAAAIKPMQDKIEAFEGERSAKDAANKAKAEFDANDYVKAYKDEASDAWERAMEVNEATGSKMTADQIKEKAMGYFNKAVQRKGVDTSKPFKSEGPEDQTRDWKKERERQEARQGIKHEEK